LGRFDNLPNGPQAALQGFNFNCTPKSQFQTIDLKCCEGDYVREVTSPATVGSGPICGQDAVGATYGSCDFVFFNRATVHTLEPISEHDSLIDAVWCKKDHFGNENYVVVKLGVF